ncbi:hypothetical protein ACFQ0M_06570 [Kitasatospora aburaviensis]
MTNALSQRGKAQLDLGRAQDAAGSYTEARRLGARVGVPLLQGIAALGQAKALDALGDRAQALTAARDAVTFAEAADDPVRLTEATALVTNWSTSPES